MECPHCHQEILTSKCPACGGNILIEGRYCMSCGVKLEERSEEVIVDDNGFDPENRILCPDGTCTGIIIDGRCIECGKPFKAEK
jgi:DNA-directed RNA polymerase subunit RPC12/RpoP